MVRGLHNLHKAFDSNLIVANIIKKKRKDYVFNSILFLISTTMAIKRSSLMMRHIFTLHDSG